MKQSLLLLAFIVAVGCKNVLKKGTVVEKWYEPTTEYMIYQPIILSDGKNTNIIPMYYWVTDNEDWVVKIKGVHNGKEKTETFYISPKQYECLVVGGEFTAGFDCSTSDNNNRKVETEETAH